MKEEEEQQYIRKNWPGVAYCQALYAWMIILNSCGREGKPGKREFRCAGSGTRGWYLHSELPNGGAIEDNMAAAVVGSSQSGAGVQSRVKRQVHAKCLQHKSSMHPEEPLCIGGKDVKAFLGVLE